MNSKTFPRTLTFPLQILIFCYSLKRCNNNNNNNHNDTRISQRQSNCEVSSSNTSPHKYISVCSRPIHPANTAFKGPRIWWLNHGYHQQTTLVLVLKDLRGSHLSLCHQVYRSFATLLPWDTSITHTEEIKSTPSGFPISLIRASCLPPQK